MALPERANQRWRLTVVSDQPARVRKLQALTAVDTFSR